MTVFATLAVLAFAVSLAAFALAWLTSRQSTRTLLDLRHHQQAHLRALGSRDPERRHRDTGPPPGTPNRRTDEPTTHRGAHAAPTDVQPAARTYTPPPVPTRPEVTP